MFDERNSSKEFQKLNFELKIKIQLKGSMPASINGSATFVKLKLSYGVVRLDLISPVINRKNSTPASEGQKYTILETQLNKTKCSCLHATSVSVFT